MNHLEDCLKPCIDSIINNTDLTNAEIIVVANGCTDGTKDYLRERARKMPYFNYLWFNEPLGFPLTNNKGLYNSLGDYVVLLNNDTVLLNNSWLDVLLQPFEDNAVGLTGPTKFFFDCAGTQREAIAFWCVAIKRDVIKKIGYLDEIFNPFGSEDIDFSIRATIAGYRLVQVPHNKACKFLEESPGSLGIANFPIYHKGSTTIDEHFNDPKKKQELENRNMAIIYDRYGKK